MVNPLRVRFAAVYSGKLHGIALVRPLVGGAYYCNPYGKLWETPCILH